jgi:hypothetical protein
MPRSTPTIVRAGLLIVQAALVGFCAAGCGGAFSGPSGPAEIVLTLPVSELEAGQQTQAVVEVNDFSGRPLPQAPVTWETSNPDVMTAVPVNATAQTVSLVAGSQGGTVMITARAGDRSISRELTVRDAGPVVLSFEGDIQPIFDRSCALPDCHGDPEEFAGEGLVLKPGKSYDLLVNVHASQVRSGDVLRVEPGNPDRSYLVAKIRGTHTQLGGRGAPMPLDGSLPEGDLEKIVQWIMAGAPRK